MEEFPGNLDDGELWLPSDIFPPEDTHHHNRPTAAVGTSMEDLSRQFSNLNFLDHRHSITQIGVYGGMKQCAVTTTTNGCYGLTVGPNVVDHGLFNCHSGPVYQIPYIPALHFPMHKPVAEQLMETRRDRSTSRPVHRQQQTWLSPLQTAECQFGFGLMRECHSSSTSSGTGVFIPRITVSSDGGKNKTGVRPQRGPARKLGTKNARDFHCYHPAFSSSEVGLPKDWTY